VFSWFHTRSYLVAKIRFTDYFKITAVIQFIPSYALWNSRSYMLWTETAYKFRNGFLELEVNLKCFNCDFF